MPKRAYLLPGLLFAVLICCNTIVNAQALSARYANVSNVKNTFVISNSQANADCIIVDMQEIV